MTHEVTDADFRLLAEVKAFLDLADGRQTTSAGTAYIACIRWAADACRLALRHGDNDFHFRNERFHRLLSPVVVEELAAAWLELQSLKAELAKEEA